eukprot:10324449-Alexandrium_andersonii.AAC.1
MPSDCARGLPGPECCSGGSMQDAARFAAAVKSGPTAGKDSALLSFLPFLAAPPATAMGAPPI